LLKRRISPPRAITVVALVAVLAAALMVTPSLAKNAAKTAQSFLTAKKAAANLYATKADVPLTPVAGIAAGTAQFGPVAATTAGYIPSAFTSFATPAKASSVVITFSGNAICTAEKATPDLACPISILVDGQSQGKINFAPATLGTPAPAAVAQSVTTTTVLAKGGHTIAVQYAGAAKVNFALKGWNLAVQAYPQPEEELETTTTGTTTTGK
jgi:hypothetical protein